MPDLPQPSPPPPPIPQAHDVDYLGCIRLEVDATDVEHRIFRVREIIPVAGGGKLHLLYPQWLPGYHSPQAPIELMGGLEIFAGDVRLEWRRHPVEMHAFEVEVPETATEIEARFQLLSPTDSSQGRVIFSREMFCLPWNGVVLYPAGHFSRRIQVEPSIVLPSGWTPFCALEQASAQNDTIHFRAVSLDVLVDSPLLAGRYARQIPLDESGTVRLNLVADQPDQIEVTEEQIAPHRELVRQVDLLFGARPFDHYDMLLALSEEIDGIGVEHHRSCEAVSIPGYFRDWDSTFARRDTLPHEYLHSWNGKFRRGADSWTPSFQDPIRSSLMWVYEGQTQYWDRVMCARSGLWQKEHALGALAEIAATHECRAGNAWRPLSDTTRDPVIAARASLPWPSWQRSEDYYTEGALIWLDVDTRLREMTGEERSLDDFARSFFRAEEGVWTTSTYTFDDVVEGLSAVAPFAWGPFLDEKLNRVSREAPLDGLARGGYRLAYKQQQSAYQQNKEAISSSTNLLFSIGLMLGSSGKVTEVLWDSPAFVAGITAASTILAVNERAYSADAMKRAITLAEEGSEINLLVQEGKRHMEKRVACHTGHRYPHLERIEGTRDRLGDILTAIAG
jgi:predicted metalloprotease with PDZ domain